jgi:hypothetical protein
MSHRFGTLRTWQGTSNSEILKMARSCHLPQVPSSPNHWRLPKSWGYPKWMALFHGQSMYKWTKYGVPPLKWKPPYGWDEEAHPAISFFLFFPMLKWRETCWYFSFLFLNLPRSCENPNGWYAYHMLLPCSSFHIRYAHAGFLTAADSVLQSIRGAVRRVGWTWCEHLVCQTLENGFDVEFPFGNSTLCYWTCHL